MNFSHPQQWLTLGFSVVLTTLLGATLLAYQAIINREYLFEGVTEEGNGHADLNDFLVAIAQADVSHQAYLKSGKEDRLREVYGHLEIASNDLDDLLHEDKEAWLHEETLKSLKIALENRIKILEESVRQLEAPPSLQTQIDLAEQRSKAQLEIHLAVQTLLEEGSIDQQWEIADTSLSINNELWILGLVAGLSTLTSVTLYVWLLKTLRRSQQAQTTLEHEKERVSEKLKTKTAHLLSTQDALEKESSRCQAMETTYKKIEQAKELTDIKLNFFSLASHELRTPLSAILVSAQLLDNPKAQWSQAKRSRNLRRIQSSAKTMTQLLADILLLTRAEAGKLEFTPQTIEIHSFCSRLVEDVKFNTQAQHQILVQQQGECTIACLDESLLRAMLMSLLTNAIKYSPQESEIRLTILAQHGHTRFQMTDQGIGIPAADQKQLFDSFHRGENVKSISGTGLGLAVVKKCLELHGGAIAVESQVGIGTTFTIDLPWVDTPAECGYAPV